MAVTVRVQGPLFSSVSCWSAKAPMQTSPKRPLSATMRSSSGGGAVPETATIRGLAGSLLTIVMLAAFGPKLIGWKRIGRAIELPAAISSG